MNKKILTIILFVMIIAVTIILVASYNGEDRSNVDNSTIQNTEILNQTIKENRMENMDVVYIKMNHQVFSVALEDNAATTELKERLKNKDITIYAHEYGGFEKIGELGFSLPRKDTSIQTVAGDIVLYQGNQISLFYNSNSWNYTKIGRIQNVNQNELKKILGSGDVTIILSLTP